MASLMENLIDVLDRESTEYEALLQLSQRKTPIIAGGDLAELQKITDEEQELVSRIHNLDKQRAGDRKSTRLNSSHRSQSRMPSSA